MGELLNLAPKEIAYWQKKWPFLKNATIERSVEQMYTYKWNVGNYMVYYDIDSKLELSRMTIWKKGDLKPMGDTLSISEDRKECIKSSNFLLKCFENLLRAG